ncbi:DnaJ-class molecular chaperone [Kitasatospora sp. MAP12-15]|uniref:hypothetical protein n=1 Tax=unclassified Kitasatospora TaxID=2633591 RepID=UPI002476BAA4|nr:hypothetical protein [Kitasatospora sp. MAP12-44]MDH6108835.1 DnaJ-class molecular chaperone [Kitasatospora sp. MAP12-44]
MSEESEQPTGPGFAQFRMACPNCDGGITVKSRMATQSVMGRDGKPIVAAGTAYVRQKCRDCNGDGWLPLGSGEWKGRPKPTAE